MATLFSKFDREQDLEWLSDRPEVQRILAELMHRPLADIQQALPSRQPTGDTRLVPLTDLRFARELDLSRERLFPGIPETLYEPATWDASWWHAPSGSGRSLVGAWLTARGLATHVALETVRELDAVPPRGPLFLEITSDDPDLAPDELLRRLGAAERPVCVATTRALPHGTARWRSLQSPPLERVVPELVEWVAARLGEEGHFEPERALAWMRRVALPSGAAQTVGDALGLLGMLDEVRPRTLTGRSLDEVAESFVRARIEQSSRESTVGTWLAQNAFSALAGTIAQLIAESDRSLTAPRTFDEWLALVPEEHRRGVDVEWMKSALVAGSTSQTTTWRWKGDDVARAARKLPPGGYQLLRAFEHARLLVKDGDRLRLAPHWLTTLLRARATSSLLAASPFVWGEALLRPAHAATALRSLAEHAARGKLEPLYAVLDVDAPENPAYAVAVEAAATAAGVALLAGSNLPSDLVSDLFAEQRRLLITDVDGAPAPRLPHPPTAFEHEPLLHPATWLLAQLALAERSEGPKSRRGFDPWRSSDPAATRRLLAGHVYPRLDELVLELGRAPVTVSSGSARHETPAWTLAVFSMVDRLRRSVGPASELPFFVELPSAICDAFAVGGASRALLERLFQNPLALQGLFEVARARGTARSALARELWASLSRLPSLPVGLEASLGSDTGAMRELWSEAPVELVRRRVAAREPLPWRHLLPHHYSAILSSSAQLPSEAVPTAPRSVLFEVLEARGLSCIEPAGVSRLWLDAQRELTLLFTRRLDARRLDELGLFLETAEPALSAPDSTLLAELVRTLSTHADVTTFPREALLELQRWLARSVAARAPGWRDAYPLLHLAHQALVRL